MQTKFWAHQPLIYWVWDALPGGEVECEADHSPIHLHGKELKQSGI